jgi:hypothetical protein
LGNLIQGFETGLYLEGNEPFSLSNTQIDNCGTGISVQGGSLASNIGPGVSVDSSDGLGIYLFGGKAAFDGVLVANSGQSGFFTENGGFPVFGSGGLEISGSGLHGAHFDGIAGSVIIENLEVSDSENSGIRLTDCSPIISGNNLISGPGGSGIFCDGSSSSINDVQIDGVLNGIRVFSLGDPHVRGCLITNCYDGVILGLDGRGDFGNSGDHGLNVFSNITRSYAVNFNTTHTLSFLYNCFDGTPSPPADKFGLKKNPLGIPLGPILYSPGYCQ